jgi:hypothetical protein
MYAMRMDNTALRSVGDAFARMPQRMNREIAPVLKTAGLMVLEAAGPFVPVMYGVLQRSGKVAVGQRLGGPELTITYGGMASKYAEVQHERDDFAHSLSAAIVKASRRAGQSHLIGMTRQRARAELKRGGLTKWEQWIYTSFAKGYQNPKATAHWLYGRAHSAWERTKDEVLRFVAEKAHLIVERVIGEAAGGA